jgi:hypothetical protein
MTGQATKALHDKWNWDGEGDVRASAFLKAAGYYLRSDFHWTMPDPLHVPSEDELSAVTFMMQEWDYGGIINAATGAAVGRGRMG